MNNIKFVSPADNSNLVSDSDGYRDASGNIFPVEGGIPNFVYPQKLLASDSKSLEWYRDNAQTYDEYLPLTFETFRVSEDVEREKLINALDIEPNHAILEIGAGSGRDSVRIASKLDETGRLFLSDISPDIFSHAVDKFTSQSFRPRVDFFLANGSHLPFEDHSFDRVFHFGGINTFGDVGQAFREMVRVCKPGGRIVVGDENMPAWLRSSDFGRILMNSNPLYRDEIPLSLLPVEARNVKLEWFIGGVFYFISFDVGVGEPFADIDFQIPGPRGGTHRTRFYGHLEGITPEAQSLARQARSKTGESMHSWLSRVISEAASSELKK